MSANENERRGGDARGRDLSGRERRLQQRVDQRQAVAEGRESFADQFDIDVDPQEDVNIDRSGDSPTLSLTSDAEQRRRERLRESTAEDISSDVGVDVSAEEVQLTDDGGVTLADDARSRVDQARLNDLRGELPSKQDITFPVDSAAATNTILGLRDVLASGNNERIADIAQAGIGFNTDSPVSALKSLEPSDAENIDTLERDQIKAAKTALQERQQQFDSADPTTFLQDIQSSGGLGTVATALQRGADAGLDRQFAVGDAIEERESELESEIAAEEGVPDDAIEVQEADTGIGITASVTDEFREEQRQEQRTEFRNRVAQQADVSASVIDVEQDGDRLAASVDEEEFAAEVADEQGLAENQVSVERRDGQLVATAAVRQEADTDSGGASPPRDGDIQFATGDTRDIAAPAGRASGVTSGDVVGELPNPSENINQSLIDDATDSGGLLAENRTSDGGVVPSVVIPGLNISTTEEATRASADIGSEIIEEAENLDVEPATPAGAAVTEATGVNLGEEVAAGGGAFIGGALSAPQAAESSIEFAQNAPVSAESAETAAAVGETTVVSAGRQAVEEPIQFGTGVGLGVVTGTAAARGARFAGGRSLSGAQRVTPDRSTGEIFDDVATRTKSQFSGESRGQASIVPRGRRDTGSDTDSGGSGVVDDELLDEFESSSPSAGRSNIDVDPRQTQRVERAGRRGEQRAIERDIEADTPDLEDRGQPSGQSAEVRSVDRPESVSTQDIDVADAGRGADRVLNPDTSDFTASERIEARNIGRSLADPDFPRGVPRSSKAGLSENPVRAGRATADTGPSAATVTDDVAAAATVTEAGEAASSARQPEGPRVEERVPEEPTTTDDSPAGIVTGSPTLTGSQTPTTGQTLLETAQTDDLSAGSQASAVAVGSAVESQLDSRLSAAPLAETAGAQDTRPEVGVGVGLGIDTATGVVSRSQSDVNTRTATDTATTATGRPASDTAATTLRDTTAPGEISRFFATSGFGAPTTTTSTPTAVPTPTPPTSPGPRRAARSGESESRAVNGEEGGLISGDLGDEDFGVPQPGWFAETLQARAFGGLTQRGVASEQAQSASIGLGLPTERVAEAEGQEQQQLELVAGQLGLDIFEEES